MFWLHGLERGPSRPERGTLVAHHAVGAPRPRRLASSRVLHNHLDPLGALVNAMPGHMSGQGRPAAHRPGRPLSAEPVERVGLQHRRPTSEARRSTRQRLDELKPSTPTDGRRARPRGTSSGGEKVRRLRAGGTPGRRRAADPAKPRGRRAQQAAVCSECKKSPLRLLPFSLPIPSDDTVPLRSSFAPSFGPSRGRCPGFALEALVGSRRKNALKARVAKAWRPRARACCCAFRSPLSSTLLLIPFADRS